MSGAANSLGSVSLTFQALREANVARLPLFKNRRGGPAHPTPDGSDWSLGEWCNAVLGELGEAANLIKKVQRGDLTLDEARPELAKEYADVVTYLDILAFRTGVDLGITTAKKWNEVSARVGLTLRIAEFERGREPGREHELRAAVDAAAILVSQIRPHFPHSESVQLREAWERVYAAIDAANDPAFAVDGDVSRVLFTGALP